MTNPAFVMINDFIDQKLFATRLVGRTHYLVASADDSTDGFLQLAMQSQPWGWQWPCTTTLPPGISFKSSFNPLFASRIRNSSNRKACLPTCATSGPSGKL
ncbi:hypothetical protein [Ferribacterium limneticum]|uniref:hypothetical protein n=1 Tax=Ferribacterium limneticum TaxID=76259 RepID=UPI001CFA82E9|nr:hypothetical protein [Ferribacterium limneticum]UCV30180.1 hypothetical protein KI617_08945 [Ferribacterium limneticum]UCV34099.1 hypothetical protein KI608_08945 [Ferribacterium limneticum]